MYTKIIKALSLLLPLTIFVNGLFAQSMGKYSFSTSTTGSFQSDLNSNSIDMSSATSLFGANVDASYTTNLQDIGFEFWFMGTLYTQFSAKPDGVVRLGTAINTSGATTALSSQALICLSSTDNKTSATGSVKYKLIGSAPYRTLVVQWSDIQMPYNGTSNSNYSSFQLRLYEKTGKVEFVYGQMWNNSNTSQSISAFISSSTSSGKIGAVQSITNTPAYVSNVTSAPTTAISANSAITNLNSPSDGSRRTFLFTPPYGFSDPNTLTFAGTSCSGTTLNWYSSAPTTNVLKYAIYNSTDNINFSYVNTVNIGTNLYSATGLAKNTDYYWKLCAVSEGGVGSFISNSMATLGPISISDPSASAQNICQNGTATSLSFNISGVSPTYQWYYNTTSSNTGGTSISSTNNSAYTPLTTAVNARYYYCTATSSGCSITSAPSGLITINSLPTVSSSSGATICGSGTGAISATPSAGATIDWYSASTGGTPLSSGSNNFTSPAISSSTTYYAEARNLTTGCTSSARTAVSITVNSRPTVTSVTGASRCSVGTVQLSANGSGSSTIDWYSAATGGTALLTGNTYYTTPSLSSTATYYAESRNGTGGCTSAARTPVTAAINIVSAPAATDYYQCDPGTAVISATPSAGETIDWYSAATGGTALKQSSASYTTPNLTSSYNIYYAGSKNTATGCVSSSRTPVNIYVSYSPSNIMLSSNTSTICQGSSQALSITGGTISNIFVEKFNNGLSSSFTQSVLTGAISTYYSEGTGSAYLTQASGKTGYYTSNAIDLTNSSSIKLTFKHICATEAGFDYGYVEYSPNGGTSWTTFPTSAYTGTATLKNSVVSFDKSSYTAWDNNFYSAGVTPGTSPAAALWRSETISIPAGAYTSSFKIRFKYVTDASSEYYGWLIDDILISGTKTISVAWSPTSGLYTDAANTAAYAGGDSRTVYAKPSSSTAYTVTATNGSCSSIGSSSITVSAPIILSIGSPTICDGGSATLIAIGANTYSWSNGSNGASISVSPSSTTSYTVTASDQYGCHATKAATVTVNANPVLSANSATACSGSSAILTASGANTYAWSNGTNGTSISVSPSSTAIYTVIGTSNGCSSQATSTVTVNSNPALSINSPTISRSTSTMLTVSGATSYTWSNGANTNTISVSPTVTTTYSVIGKSNGCYSTIATTVFVNAPINTNTVGIAGKIRGVAQVCSYIDSPSFVKYDIDDVSNATYYQWDLPDGTDIIGGQGTKSIMVRFNSGFYPDTFIVTPKNGSITGGSSKLYVGIADDPIIVGNKCSSPLNTLRTYSVSNYQPNTTYTWKMPYGATLVSGQGTYSCTAKMSTSIRSESLTVTFTNTCGSKTGSILIVTPPYRPSVVSGPISVCTNTANTYQYYASAVAGATGYYWKAPTSSSIVSGQMSDTVSIVFSPNFKSGSISVMSLNECSTSPMSYYGVSGINTSSTTPSINGITNLCGYLGSAITYSVISEPDAIYSWNIPPTFTVVNGTWTNLITLKVPSTFSSGVISVTKEDACGKFQTSSLSLSTISTSITVSNITCNVSNICSYVGSSSNVTYAMPTITGVSSYSWSVPGNASIVSGQGTNKIAVRFLAGFTSGVITASVYPNCGAPVVKTISANPSPVVGLINGFRCIVPGTTNAYKYNDPNKTTIPVTYSWTAPPTTTITGQGTANIQISFPSDYKTRCKNNMCDTIYLKMDFGCAVKTIKFRVGLAINQQVTISGATTACPGTTITLNVNSLKDITSYYWSKPSTVTQIANASPLDTVFRFKANSTFAGGQFGVMSVNECQTSAYKYFYVSKSASCVTLKLKKEGDTSMAEPIREIEQALVEEMDFIVFPNPGRNAIQLRIFRGAGKYYHVNIINAIGEVILNDITESEGYFNMSSYSPGVYYVTITDENEYRLTKMLIIKFSTQ